MCRKLDNGNNLCMVSCGSEIREIDSSAKNVRVIKDLPGVNMVKPHAVIRLHRSRSDFLADVLIPARR
jgi:hypothetical protein